jgi:hypothetical protein
MAPAKGSNVQKALTRHPAIRKTCSKTRLFNIAFKAATAVGNTKKGSLQAGRQARAMESVLAQSTSLPETIACVDHDSVLILSQLRRSCMLSMQLS